MSMRTPMVMVAACLLWVAAAGCDDADEVAEGDAQGGAGGSDARVDATPGGAGGEDLGAGGAPDLGADLGPDLGDTGGAGGEPEDPCVPAVARLLVCGVDEAACAAWGAGGPTREDIEAGLLAGCAQTPALAALVNAAMGDCAELVASVSAASADFAASCHGPTDPDPDLSDPLAIERWLTGKTAVMTGDDIPEWPLGYFEGANYGDATQCYSSVALSFGAAAFTTDTAFGTLLDAPQEGSVGTCDPSAVSAEVLASTRGYALEGDGVCFDVRLEFETYTVEGRGAFTPDGRTLSLELYYLGQSTGATCLDGGVGAPGVTVSEMPLGGDAVQVYRLVD